MRIVVFGAGRYGNHYLDYISNTSTGDEIVCFIDNHKSGQSIKKDNKSYKIISVNDIMEIDYDKILIAVADEKIANEMKNQLMDMQVEDNIIEIMIDDEKLMREVITPENVYGEKDLRVNWLRNYALYVLQEGIEGSVAECGVYRGMFAYYINKYFSDRKIYLFDTFEGFNKKDIENERSLKNDSFINSRYNYAGYFGNTTEQDVLRLLPFPLMADIRKGHFPETAAGIEDRFAFVNLDMDLYEPMLAGLSFFWNKMSKGGVILCHDYFLKELPGVKTAIKEFESDLGERLRMVPTGDFSSIAIIK